MQRNLFTLVPQLLSMAKSLKESFYVFAWVIFLSGNVPAFGQSFTETENFNEHTIVQYQYASASPDTPYKKKKWNGQYIGVRLVIIGAAALGSAFVNAAIHQSVGPGSSANGTFTPTQSLINGAIAGIGVGCIFAGMELTAHYGQKHKVSLISSGNQVGVVYNFK